MLDYDVQGIIDFIERNTDLGYFLTFITSFLEPFPIIGQIAPSGHFVMGMTALAVNGFFNLGWILAWASLGMIIGSFISFYLGMWADHHFNKKDYKFWQHQHIIKGKEFFRKHGGKGVFIGRFIGPISPIIAFVAGMMNMPGRSFMGYNIASAGLWAAEFMAFGYLVGISWNHVESWWAKASLLLLPTLLTLTIWSIEAGVKRLRNRA